MKKVVALMLSLLLVLPYLPSNAMESDGKIVFLIYGVNGMYRIEKKISIGNAMKMVEKLKNSEAEEIKEMLSQYGIPNITNLLSFVFGFGNGIALYTLDLAFFLLLTLIYGGSIAILFYLLFLPFSPIYCL